MADKVYKGRIGGEFKNYAPTPTEETEIANKAYVDANSGGGGTGTSNIAAGAFSGVLNVSGGNRYYDDYTSGDIVNLSLSATKALGATATVRVKGDLMGTIPADWNFSGQPKSSNASKFNELTILYVKDEDIRIVNRVVSYNAQFADPSSLTNLHIWYDGTDSNSMTFNGSNVTNLTDKAGTLNLSNTEGVGPTFNTGKLIFSEGSTVTYLDSDTTSAVLVPDVDFHGYFIFKSNSNTQKAFINNKPSSTVFFGIGLRSNSLGVGIIKNGAWYTTKGVPFSDTANYHKLEFKQKAGVITANLDGVAMTGVGQVFASTDLSFRIGGDNGEPAAQKAMDFKEFFVKSGEMTAQEKTDMETYILNKHGL